MITRDLRLQKMLAEAGVASRRQAEELISQGRVKVNGHPTKLGDKVNAKKDLVTVDDKTIELADKKYHIMLHKPRGFITTMNDEKDRKCVAELVSDIPARLYPVGRLDKDSEGLLLMTNDGAFANMISHPSGHISKLYRVTIRGMVTEDQLVTM
ncbi:MAG: pseudouridine synthase, partial [Oscillospiraceae bacterium]